MSRSAHAATWAEFLKAIGWAATYSRGALLVPGGRPLMVLPPDALTGRRLRASARWAERVAAAEGWDGDVLVVGAHPLPAVRSLPHSDPAAGLLGEHVPSGWHEPRLARDGDRPMPVWGRAHWDWGAGFWLRCGLCGRLGVHHETRSWAARPCSHEEGPWHSDDAEVPAIGRAWAEASYAVARRRSIRTTTEE